MLTSQANELSTADVVGKKTITVINESHIRRALDLLGFGELVEPAAEGSEAPVVGKGKKRKMKAPVSNLSREELLRMQQELFAGSKQRQDGQEGADDPS